MILSTCLCSRPHSHTPLPGHGAQPDESIIGKVENKTIDGLEKVFNGTENVFKGVLGALKKL